MTNPHDDTTSSEDEVAALLRIAGPRTTPPPEIRDRVHRNLVAVWENLPTPQSNRSAYSRSSIPWRRITALAAVLAVCTLAGSWWLQDVPNTAQAYVGELVYATGSYSVRGDTDPTAQRMTVGAMVTTSPRAKVTIRLGEQTSMRLDGATSATLHSAREVWLHHGRLYVDAGEDANSIQIVTRAGTVHDLGTQFEVQMIESERSGSENGRLMLAVREGAITWESAGQSTEARASKGVGEILFIDADKSVRREPLRATDPHWQWIHEAAPPFKMSSGTHYDFLVWAAREAGMSLRFRSQAVEFATRNSRPVGDIQGYLPLEAIRDVLTTSNYEVKQPSDYELEIDFQR